VTKAEPATANCFPAFPIAPAESPLSGTHAWLTEKPHPGFAPSVTAGYRRLLSGNLLNAQGNLESLRQTGVRSRSWNMYGYVLNNPLKFIDPTGTTCVYNDGDPDSPIGDNGDGQGCPQVGVGAGNPDNPDTINPQQVNVNAQQGSWLDYFFSGLAGYTQPELAQTQTYSPPTTVYVQPGSKSTQAPRAKPTLASCLLAPHDFIQQAYGGLQRPSDPLVGNNAAVPAGPVDVNKRKTSVSKGNSNYVNADGQYRAQARSLATVTVMNTISDCALMAK